MNTRTFLQAALCFLLFLGLSVPLPAATPPPPATEQAKIEALISHIENLQDATFIRNGSSYDAKTAAKFLRGKWHANEKDIKTAADFIAKAASFSSTSGKPYLIGLKDGTQTPCGDYLTAQLKKLEGSSKDKK